MNLNKSSGQLGVTNITYRDLSKRADCCRKASGGDCLPGRCSAGQPIRLSLAFELGLSDTTQRLPEDATRWLESPGPVAKVVFTLTFNRTILETTLKRCEPMTQQRQRQYHLSTYALASSACLPSASSTYEV
jgi:hypothetical protein